MTNPYRSTEMVVAEKPKPGFIIKQKPHVCPTPGWFSRWWNNVCFMDEWHCKCGVGYVWGHVYERSENEETGSLENVVLYSYEPYWVEIVPGVTYLAKNALKNPSRIRYP